MFSEGKWKQLSLDGEVLEIESVSPALIKQANGLLKAYETKINALNNKTLSQKYNNIKYLFDKYIHKLTQQHLKKKSINLASYMSQCRYGLARLYDKSNSKK